MDIGSKYSTFSRGTVHSLDSVLPFQALYTRQWRGIAKQRVLYHKVEWCNRVYTFGVKIHLKA